MQTAVMVCSVPSVLLHVGTNGRVKRVRLIDRNEGGGMAAHRQKGSLPVLKIVGKLATEEHETTCLGFHVQQ
jgi:hypothetical protein